METNSKHTPGPWRKAESQEKYRDGSPVDRYVVSESATVARVLGRYSPGGGIQPGQDDANARLIAAAPDLLAACKRALSFVESMPDNDNVGLAECLRAAIAKSEGREPWPRANS